MYDEAWFCFELENQMKKRKKNESQQLYTDC